jgi:predicted small integral membrane protein
MILIWIAVSFFSGVFFGVFVMSLARMAAQETPHPTDQLSSEEYLTDTITTIRRAG